MMRFTKFWMSAALLAGLGFAAGAAMAADNQASVSASLSSASEVPPNASAGSGKLEGSLDKTSRLLTYTLSYSGLSGPAKAAHFHGPAAVGANAGVALPFGGSLESPAKGSATLTPAQVTDLLEGKWYVNVHTAANPGGEIRGQVQVK